MGGVIVHPNRKQVIPFAPEPISLPDGSTKNDCERNASKRFLERFRREHPHLKVTVVEDGLASNAPHIALLNKLNLNYILGCKKGDHKSLFEFIDESEKLGVIEHFEITESVAETASDAAGKATKAVAKKAGKTLLKVGFKACVLALKGTPKK